MLSRAACMQRVQLKKPASDTVLQSVRSGANSELAHLRSMVAHLQVRLLQLAELALLLRSRVGTSASS
jgi:hypothetical protein